MRYVLLKAPLGKVFSECFGFPCLFPPTASHSSSSSSSGADVSSGLSLSDKSNQQCRYSNALLDLLSFTSTGSAYSRVNSSSDPEFTRFMRHVASAIDLRQFELIPRNVMD
jgi:hypothetical protein